MLFWRTQSWSCYYQQTTGLKVKPVVKPPNSSGKKFSELIDTLLKPFSRHVKLLY